MSAVDLPDGLAVDDLDFAKQDGLLPGVVQDAVTGRVLMLGYLDADAVRATLDSGLATFRSRSRGTAWVKGATSGNTLRVVAVEVDCDRDAVLLRCEPAGPTCHTGAVSCFDDAHPPDAQEPGTDEPSAAQTGAEHFLAELDALVARRHAERPEGSYTTALFAAGTRRIAQKVGEEGVETALAAVAEDDDAVVGEAADLLYHLLVLLHSRGLALADVQRLLRARHR